MFYFLYIYKYRVHALDGFKKCNRIYPVSSSCRLTLRFLPTPVQLRAQHLSLSRWAVLILLITIIEGLPLSHPLCSALWDGVLPSWWGIKPSEWTQWGEQWANGRAGKEKVTGFSIGSITVNFHWDRELQQQKNSLHLDQLFRRRLSVCGVTGEAWPGENQWWGNWEQWAVPTKCKLFNHHCGQIIRIFSFAL